MFWEQLERCVYPRRDGKNQQISGWGHDCYLWYPQQGDNNPNPGYEELASLSLGKQIKQNP